MPDWMFGYIHCRERYHSSEEILANAREFKERGLPLDVIVQDWQWWGPTGWNSMEFDKEHYPDPKALTDTLHELGTRFMISVWSKVDKNSNLGKRLAERGSYIDGTDWIDFFNPEVAAFYAQNFVDSLARPYNIDAWWFDATEPENDDLAGRRIGKDQIPGEWYRNVYPLMVNRTMYQALTAEGLSPVILTRSAFPGAQRYGVVTWSGDVGNDFETLQNTLTLWENYTEALYRNIRVTSAKGKKVLFEGMPEDVKIPDVAPQWKAFGQGKYRLLKGDAVNMDYAQEITAGAAAAGVAQGPQNVVPGETFVGSVYAKGDARLSVALVRDGRILREQALGVPVEGLPRVRPAVRHRRQGGRAVPAAVSEGVPGAVPVRGRGSERDAAHHPYEQHDHDFRDEPRHEQVPGRQHQGWSMASFAVSSGCSSRIYGVIA